MHENRTTYPKRKTEMYQQLLELPKKYKTVYNNSNEKSSFYANFTIKKNFERRSRICMC